MKKVLMGLLVLGTMSSSIYAECTATQCVGKITRIYMTAGGTLYVGTDGDEKALNCAAGEGNGGVSNVYMSLKEGDIGKNAMYALLLSASTTEKQVTIRVQEGTSDCRVLYVTN